MSDNRHEMSAAEYRAMIEREQGLTVPAAPEPKRARRASRATSMTEAEMVSEDAFMRAVLDAAKILGWMVYHTFDSRRSEPGFPDAVLVRGKRLLILEFKTEKGRIKPAQKDWIAALIEAGADARIVRPSDMEGVLNDLNKW